MSCTPVQPPFHHLPTAAHSDSLHRQSPHWCWAFTSCVFFCSTRVPTQHGVQSSTDSPLHIFSLLPLLAAQISSNCCGLQASQSKLLRRQSLLHHLLSTHGLRHLTWDTGKCLSSLYPCPQCDEANQGRSLGRTRLIEHGLVGLISRLLCHYFL
jgi:hypothetical protein